MKTKGIKFRDCVRALRTAGAVVIRTRGSHQQWKLLDGKIVGIVCNHLGADAATGFIRDLRANGIQI